MIGATGKFPQGKLKSDDEGELRMAVFEKDGVIVVDFGKKIAWIGLDKEQAREMGNLLIKKSNE